MLGATLKAGEAADYRLGWDRHAHLVPAAGVVGVNGVRSKARDGAAITGEDVLAIKAVDDAEIVRVDAA